VDVESADGGLRLRVTDDGRGFDPSANPSPGHLGLSTIAERLELAGGWLRVESEPGRGSVVECWMPLEEAPAAGA
jgi:signal transduction histidine kinase